MEKIKFVDCTDYDIGVKYLEQEFGASWFDKIDLDKLNMSNTYKCIIGQLAWNGYKDYVENLGLIFYSICDNKSNVFSSCHKEYNFETHGNNWKKIILGKRTNAASENVMVVNGNHLGTSSNLERQPQKYLLTFDDKSSMILTSLKDAPEGQKFTYEVI